MKKKAKKSIIENKHQEDEMWKRHQEDEMWRKHEEEQKSWESHETSPEETRVRLDSRKKNASKKEKHSAQPHQSPKLPNDDFYEDDIKYEKPEYRNHRPHRFVIGNLSTLLLRKPFIDFAVQDIVPYLRYRGVFPENGGDVIPWLKSWFKTSTGFYWGFTGKCPVEGDSYIVRAERSYFDAENKVFRVTFSIGNCHGIIESATQLSDSFSVKINYVVGLFCKAELAGQNQITSSRLIPKTFVFFTAEGITGELSQFLDTGAIEIKKIWANEKLPLDLLLRMPGENLIQLDMFPLRQVWMTENDPCSFVVDCDACQTKGKIECRVCHGEREVECKRCGGTGTVTLPAKEVTCQRCGGSGSFGNGDCFKCGGTGVFELPERDIDCNNCDGSGYLECNACDGQGQKECYACKGTGVDFVSFNRDTQHFFKTVKDVKIEYDSDEVYVYNPETEGKISLDGGWFELAKEVSTRNAIAERIKENKKKLLADGQSISQCLDEALKLAPAISSPIELCNPSGTSDRSHRKVILEFQINGHPKWLKQGISPYPDGTPLNIVNIDFPEEIQSRIEFRGIDLSKRTIKIAFPSNIDSGCLENTIVKIVPGCPPPPEKCQKRYLEYWLEDDENRLIDAISSGVRESKKPIKSFFNQGIKKYPSQVKAVQQGVSDSEVMLLQGPPGTGKTTVIVEIIRQALKRGDRILVTSQTHQAVCNVLEKLHALNESHQAYIPMVRYASRDNKLSEIEKLYEAGYQEEERKSILERALKALNTLQKKIDEYEYDNSIYPEAIATALEIENIIALRQKDVLDNQAACQKEEDEIEHTYQERMNQTSSEYNKRNNYFEELIRQLSIKILQLTELKQNRESCIEYEKDVAILEVIVENAKKLLEIRKKLKLDLENNQQSRERQRKEIRSRYAGILKTATADFKKKDKINSSSASAAKAKLTSLESCLRHTLSLIRTYESRLANRTKDSLIDKVFSLIDKIPLLHTAQSVESVQTELTRERKNQTTIEPAIDEAKIEFNRLHKIECDFRDGFQHFQDDQQVREKAEQESNDKQHDMTASALNQHAAETISSILEQQKTSISKLKTVGVHLDCDDAVNDWSKRLTDTQTKIQTLYVEADKIRNRDCNTGYLNEQIRIRSHGQPFSILTPDKSDISPVDISSDLEKFVKYQHVFEDDKKAADDKYNSDVRQHDSDRQNGISDTRRKHDDIRISIEQTASEKLGPLYTMQDRRCASFKRAHIKDGKETSAKSWTTYFSRSKQLVNELKKRASVVERWTRDLEANPEALSKFLDSQTKVFFSTCVGLGSWKEIRDGTYERITPDTQAIIKSKFDLVIIDEAGHATFSETIIPMCYAKKVLLIGDDKQLPPILGNDLPCHENMCSTCLSGVNGNKEECWFEYSLFTYLWQNANFQLPRLMLDTQFRMHPDIGDFISSAFYAGKLHNGVTSQERMFTFGPFQKPVCVVSTSGKPKRYETYTDPSYFNEMEARYIERIIGSLVDDLQERPSAGKKDETKVSLAVITPYSSQVDLLRRSLSKFFNKVSTLDFTAEHIASVDKFQGSERDIIITSFVRSPEPCSSCNGTGRRKGSGCPTCKGKGHRSVSLCFVHDLKRMNVAFSRARKILILVGDIEALCKYKGTEEGKEVLQQFHDYVKDKGRVLHVLEEENK